MSSRSGRRVEELKRRVNERLMYRDNKHRKKVLLRNSINHDKNNERFLISVTVPGSVGPIRFVANHNDTVLAVIRSSLKRYAQEGRIPTIGMDVDSFLLYSSNVGGSNALSPMEAIGHYEGRNFVMCKNANQSLEGRVLQRAEIVGCKGQRCCKEWMFKSIPRKLWKRTSSRVEIQASLIMRVTPTAWINGSSSSTEDNPISTIQLTDSCTPYASIK